ncbi:oligosaccharide flippase family protein [Infirmifilum sp. SLHALR2]
MELEDFLRGTAWLTAGQLTATFIAGLASIAIARILGPSGYGLYSLSISAAGLLALLSWLGVDQAAVRKASRDRQSSKQVLDTALTFALLNALAVAAAGLASSQLLAQAVGRPEIAATVALASLSVALAIPLAATNLLTAVGRADVPAKAGVALQLLRAALVPSLALAAGYYGAVTGHSAAYLLAALIALALYRRATGPWRPTLTGLRELISFGAPLWLPGILGTLVAFARTAATGQLLANAEIGALAAAMNFSALAGILVTPFSSMALPYISSSNGGERRALRHVVRTSALVSAPIAVYTLLYAEPLVQAVYGEAYSAAALPLRVLALQYLLPLFGSTALTQYLVARGDNKTVLKASIASSLTQLAAIYPLTLAARTLGVAASIILSQAAGLTYTYLKARENALEPTPLLPALIAALPSLPLILAGTHPLLKATAGMAVYTASYILAALATGTLTRAEVSTLITALRPATLKAQPLNTRGTAQ